MSYDAADQAQGLVEQLLKASLDNHKPIEVPLSGFCLHCEEPIEAARFCGVDCRDDYDKEIKRKVRAGLIRRNF